MTPKPPLAPVQTVLTPLSLSMHELQVTLTLPAQAVAKGAVLALPVWTPGSYLVRDYPRFLDRITAVDAKGVPLTLVKRDTSSWVLPPCAGATVTYRLFCNDLTVRTNHVDADHAHLVGAATFLYLEGQQDRPVRVRFEGWPTTWAVATALPLEGDDYVAADHDQLVDSPFELGTFRLHTFAASGATFQMAITGDHPGDEPRMVAATRAMVTVCAELFGGFPFQRYLFLLTFSPGTRGGLEHRDCTSLLADPLAMARAEGHWELCTLIAHEFFHVWNVKRLRDPALGPFAYQGENVTRLLWFHEGFTSFMQFTIALRAGVVPWAWVARKLGQSWTDNTTRAGRREQTLEEASFDAWIRHYKPSEFAANSTVSYYDKGALVAWMMDAELRLASGGATGLDRLFRLLWERAGDGPVTDAMLRGLYQELTGQDAGPFWSAYIQGTAELDAQGIERAYGLKLAAKAPWEALAEDEDPGPARRARGFAGLVLGQDGPTLHSVVPGSPGAEAGLSYGMEILAVDGWRTDSAQAVQHHLGLGGPGEAKVLLATDRGRVRAYTLTLAENPQRNTQVAFDPKATAAQVAAFTAWTSQSAPARLRRPRP